MFNIKITNAETFWTQGNIVNRYITFRGIPSGCFELQMVPTDACRMTFSCSLLEARVSQILRQVRFIAT